VVRILAGAFEMSTLPNRAEMRLKPSGKVIGYTLSLVRDERLRVHGAALFFKDLTLVEQAEERERLRDRLAALGEMAATIAHESEEPPGEHRGDGGPRAAPGGRSRRSARHAVGHHQRGEDGQRHRRRSAGVREADPPADGPDLAPEVVEDAIPLAERQDCQGETRIEVAVPEGLPAIQGDHHQLCQVVTNLLINALEALGGQGTVRISATMNPGEMEEQPPEVELVIADDGPGIPGDITDRVFNPFFTTSRRVRPGAGDCAEDRDAHDGRIDVTTGADLGTSFTIALRGRRARASGILECGCRGLRVHRPFTRRRAPYAVMKPVVVRL